MKTTATNRKVRTLLTAIKDQTLVPRPEFQRRLVWSNKHKRAFLDTVIKGYPFPEIYIAAGEVNPDTAEGTELLVDGQQRITTLHQYFTGSKDLILDGALKPYAALSPEEKKLFLEYDVVVRDLGSLKVEQIREVFKRINSTRYSLNAMEIHNARFDGEFKAFGETLAESAFFEDHRVFTASDIKRMHDVRFCLVLAVTIMSTYFDGDTELEVYLEKYNDEFPKGKAVAAGIKKVMDVINAARFESDSRAWKKPDLLSLLVELYRYHVEQKKPINPAALGREISKFYGRIDNFSSREKDAKVLKYFKAVQQGTNHRGNRIARGEVIAELISDCQ